MPKPTIIDATSAKQSRTNWQSSYPYLTTIGIFYFVAQLFDETFVTSEVIEYCNDDFDKATGKYIGFASSFLPALFMVATLLFYLQKKQKNHGHYHSVPDTDTSDILESEDLIDVDTAAAKPITEHHHSKLETLGDIVAIGIPFSLIGVGAYLETIEQIATTPLWSRIIGSTLVGLLSGYGAYQVHGFYAHEASGGQGAKGFLRGILHTYYTNVHSVTNAWKKWGILIGHAFAGYFAASTFTRTTELTNYTALDIPLKIALTLLVTLFEGNTEARCIDAKELLSKQIPESSHALTALKWISAIVPSLTTVLGLAQAIGPVNSGPANGKVYNTLIIAISSLLLLYPNASGFYALSHEPAESLYQKLRHKAKSTPEQDEQAMTLIGHSEELATTVDSTDNLITIEPASAIARHTV